MGTGNVNTNSTGQVGWWGCCMEGEEKVGKRHYCVSKTTSGMIHVRSIVILG